MPNPYFRFKQFTVWHDQCAMRVNTDGVLLGAWTKIDHPQLVLDIGTGSGLIALMMAQRSEAMVHAVDIEDNACRQARINVGNSPWPERIKVQHVDFCTYYKNYSGKYDLIVSNPPYFSNSLKNPDPLKVLARHADSLPVSVFISGVCQLLSENGIFSVILPADTLEFESEAFLNGLKCSRRMRVRHFPGGNVIRHMLEYTKTETSIALMDEELNICDEQGKYSYSYKRVTQDFYLNF